MEAFHWLQMDMKAGNGTEKAWKLGEERTMPKRARIKLCERGYHSSPTLFDALQYAPGPMACIVDIGEPVEKDESKFVSRSRKLLAFADVSAELRQFAIDCAERALDHEREQGREPDARSWAALEASRAFLRGEITPEELTAAYSAASSAANSAANYAASSAAYYAAYSAANSAANYAASSAAYYAASSAAYYAASYAANYAASSAAKEWQRQRFDEVVLPRLTSAARFAEMPS